MGYTVQKVVETHVGFYTGIVYILFNKCAYAQESHCTMAVYYFKSAAGAHFCSSCPGAM